MTFTRIHSGLLALVAAAFIATSGAKAQEITQEHIDAAIAALKSAKASQGFDLLLPAVSERVQNQLIRMRPDLHREIADVVEGVALKLVSRRADLDNDIARTWARAFTIEELDAIRAFYQSPAGQKFATTGPKVISDSYQVAQGWSSRLSEEMYERAREEFKKQGVEF